MAKKYVIGIDFGTLSARAVLLDTENASEVAESVFEYPHAVMSQTLPSGESLPVGFALQHPKDYLDALENTVKGVLKASGVSPDLIRSLGIDFTACTLLPIDKDGTPLCMSEKYKDNKHAYVKLWKHHSAEKYAQEINALAEKRGEEWLGIYGGKVSCEWALPKILETLREARDVYDDTYRFIEAADWLSFVLTGKESYSAPFAGYKWLWNAETGYPSNDFFVALDKGLDKIVGTKISEEVLGIDKIAGYIDEKGANLTGLKVGTPVSLPMIDAHSAMPALNITDEGTLMLILGTSACYIMNAKDGVKMDGICGYVKDGVIPGAYTYEAGQSAVGDIFDWFVKNCTPKSYYDEAETKGVNIHALLTEKAEKLKVGESGLVALDWFNGNRSILDNYDLRGMILGMTLNTKPEEIYRALIESTAFGLRVIVSQYEKYGIPINKLVASGGIARKNSMMMQIFSNVINREIHIAESSQTGALGSSIYASVAAGIYPDVKIASEKLSSPCTKVYKPESENVKAYDELYREYKTLHDYFGCENKVMERLAEISKRAK